MLEKQVGIIDPPRPEIASVVKTCRGAGMRLFMVTGDHALTAVAIARQVGIVSSGSTVDSIADVLRKAKDVRDGSPLREIAITATDAKPEALTLTGADFASLTPDSWDVITQYQEVVFARTTPEQKLQVVKAFQERKNVVAVTGDGVNDAPALKNADIGVAMGTGSDVATEAGAMVLLDSNFSSIVVALREGRTVFDNLKKVCLYLLPAGSFSELTPVLVNLLLGVPAPLSGFFMMYAILLVFFF